MMLSVLVWLALFPVDKKIVEEIHVRNIKISYVLRGCTFYGDSPISKDQNEVILCMYDDKTGSLWQLVVYPTGRYWMPIQTLPVPKRLK